MKRKYTFKKNHKITGTLTRIMAASVLLIGMMAVNGHSIRFGSKSTTAAQFLEVPVGARAIGMGGAFSAVCDDANSIYWNPAGLASLDGDSLTFMHSMMFENVNYEYLAYAFPFPQIGVMGVALQYLSYGKLEERDYLGDQRGTFSPKDMAANFSYSTMWQGLHIGGTLKYISSKIRDTASMAALDAGIQYPIWNDKLMLSGAVKNIGGKMKFGVERNELPLNVSVGAAWQYSKKLLFSGEVTGSRNGEPFVSAGTEYNFYRADNLKAYGRAGYNTRMITSELGALAGASVGLGFELKQMRFDYAWVPMGDLGQTHYISMGLRFSGEEEVQTKVIIREVYKEIRVEETDRGLTVSLSSKVLFDTGKAELKDEAKSMLKELTKLLGAYPENQVQIEGYTDNVGSDDFNKLLSEYRAQAVYNYLVSHGVNAGRLKAIGYGKTKPVASNLKEEGRARNRRVEVIILKKEVKSETKSITK
jgi:outer membrane protein OmpA-like peptidoglycan-associated protein